MKKKLNKRSIFNKAKAKSQVKENYTFRMPVSLMEDFKALCEEKDAKPTRVLEELIRELVEQ